MAHASCHHSHQCKDPVPPPPPPALARSLSHSLAASLTGLILLTALRALARSVCRFLKDAIATASYGLKLQLQQELDAHKKDCSDCHHSIASAHEFSRAHPDLLHAIHMDSHHGVSLMHTFPVTKASLPALHGVTAWTTPFVGRRVTSRSAPECCTRALLTMLGETPSMEMPGGSSVPAASRSDQMLSYLFLDGEGHGVNSACTALGTLAKSPLTLLSSRCRCNDWLPQAGHKTCERNRQALLRCAHPVYLD